MESGEFAGCNTLPENFTEVILQNFELHCGEYSKSGTASGLGFRAQVGEIKNPTSRAKNAREAGHPCETGIHQSALRFFLNLFLRGSDMEGHEGTAVRSLDWRDFEELRLGL
jgi:hypothetical protein